MIETDDIKYCPECETELAHSNEYRIASDGELCCIHCEDRVNKKLIAYDEMWEEILADEAYLESH